jgi:hypothetical protein
MYFYSCLHKEGGGDLETDLSTMASVCKHSIEKIFHNKAEIGDTFFSPCAHATFSTFSVTRQHQQSPI